jgi:hypothetical protein
MSSRFSYVRIGETYLQKEVAVMILMYVYQLNMSCIKMLSDRPRDKDKLY